MISRLIFFVMILSIYVTLLPPQNSFAAEPTVIKLVTGEYSPYSSDKLYGYGLVPEIVTSCFVEMGIEPDYQFFPWKRCEYEITKGRVWAAFPYAMNKKRVKQFIFSDPVILSRTIFFFYQNEKLKQFSWNKLEDLKPYRIGGVRGYFYENRFKDAGLKTDYAPNEKLSLRKLRAGRVDIVPLNEHVGWNLINRLFPNSVANFGTLEKELTTNTLHLMISKTYPDSQELTDKFNIALKTIKDKGIYSQILKKQPKYIESQK